jgi:hypothetical protein
MFVVGAFAFNLAGLLVLCAAGRMRATFTAWPWVAHLPACWEHLLPWMQPGRWWAVLLLPNSTRLATDTRGLSL